MTRIGGIALLLGSCRCPIGVHRPLRNCPRLVLGRRSFLSVRTWIVAGCHLSPVTWIVAGCHLSPVTWIVAGCHLSPVTWLIVSCIEAPRLRVSRFLVSYSFVIFPGVFLGIFFPRILPPPTHHP